LRGHGDRGNQKIVSDRIKRDDNNSVNRRWEHF
jgi:hypothetical protein